MSVQLTDNEVIQAWDEFRLVLFTDLTQRNAGSDISWRILRRWIFY